MRRTFLGLLAAVMVAAPLAVAAPASATGDLDTDHEGRVLVAWSMPAGIPSWPQKFAAAVDNNVLDLNMLDAQLAALPGCTDYQIDLYDDTEALDALLAYGTLGDGVVPEPGVVTWKYLTAGTGCYEPPPSIGGKTIGFWTNKNGTAAGASLWGTVASTYPSVVQGLSFSAAQTFIRNATSADDGSAMLRAQFFATALNSLYLDGYGVQGVDTDGLLDLGECATVNQFLAAVNAQWGSASLDTKAERVAVKDVLDRINQDVPLAPLQCNPAT